MQTEPLADVVKTLEDYDQHVGEDVVDLKLAAYKRDAEFGSLTVKNQRYEMTQNSAKQFCRALHLPYGFVKHASEPLAADAVKEFTEQLDKSEAKLIFYQQAQHAVLRGLVPPKQTVVRNSTMLKPFVALGDDAQVQHAPWRDKPHEAIVRTRLVWPLSSASLANIQKDDLMLGLDIMGSDVGVCPQQLNLLLFRVVCENGAIASFGDRPYFYFDSRSAVVFDFADLVARIAERVVSDIPMFQAQVATAMSTKVVFAQVKEQLGGYVNQHLLPKGAVIRALGLLEKDGCDTAWDVANAVTSTARGYRDVVRVRLERFAGKMLGLDFKRHDPETDYAKNIAPLLLPAPTN